MVVELKPETEQLVKDELRRGHFQSLDELIVQGIESWRQIHPEADPQIKPRKTIHELLSNPPFAGSELQIERISELPRSIDIG